MNVDAEDKFKFRGRVLDEVPLILSDHDKLFDPLFLYGAPIFVLTVE